MDRRRFLAGASLALVPVAGCVGDGPVGADDETDAEESNDAATDGDDENSDGTGGGDADDVSIDGRLHNEADEALTFEVTIRDRDGDVIGEGEWEVEPDSTETIPAFGRPGETRTFDVAVNGAEATETLAFDVEPSPGKREGYVDITYAGEGKIEIAFAPANGEARYPDDRDVPNGRSTHHLFVENFDPEPHVVELTVVCADGALVWRNTYEAPDERAFYVPDILVEGRTYEIALAIRDGPRATTEQAVEPCPHEGDSRNVGIRIKDGTISFEQDGCDELRVGAELPSGDHERFVRDSTDGGDR